MKGAENLSGLHPVFRAAVDYLLAECDSRHLAPVVVEGWRSPRRQDQLYRQGRTTGGPRVTSARAWQSAHQYGLAVDITSGYGWNSWQAHQIGRLAASLGFGRVSGDLPHVQYPGWRQLLR